MKIPVILWSYITKCKQFMRKTPFKIVYGQEGIISMEYIVPSLRIVAATTITMKRYLKNG